MKHFKLIFATAALTVGSLCAAESFEDFRKDLRRLLDENIDIYMSDKTKSAIAPIVNDFFNGKNLTPEEKKTLLIQYLKLFNVHALQIAHNSPESLRVLHNELVKIYEAAGRPVWYRGEDDYAVYQQFVTQAGAKLNALSDEELLKMSAIVRVAKDPESKKFNKWLEEEVVSLPAEKAISIPYIGFEGLCCIIECGLSADIRLCDGREKVIGDILSEICRP